MKISETKKEIARDIIALGSVPFFVLVLIRVWILNNPEFFSRFAISGVLFLVFFFLFKDKVNLYSGLGLIILILTSSYYQDKRFTVFSSLVYLGLVYSLIYLSERKLKVFTGVVIGLLCSLVGYFSPGMF